LIADVAPRKHFTLVVKPLDFNPQWMVLDLSH